MISYQIFKTRLLNETKYLARIQLKQTYDQKMLVDRMLEIGTSVSKEDVTSILNLFQTAIERICSEGSNINLEGFLRFTPAIGGTFDYEGDGYLSTRNSVYVNAKISSVFNNRFNLNTRVEKEAASFKSPQMYTIDDLASDTSNQKVTPANIIDITGERMKFDQANPVEYLRFVNADNPTDFVPISKFQKLTDKELVFLMPATTFKTGYFEIASTMNTSRLRVDKSSVLEVFVA